MKRNSEYQMMLMSWLLKNVGNFNILKRTQSIFWIDKLWNM